MDFEEAHDLESDDEDCAHRLEMAMALSLSVGAEEAVVGESLSADVNRGDLPDFLTVKPIPGDGWCLYECVVDHLSLAENELPNSCGSAKASICALCLWCLALHCEEMVDFSVTPMRFLSDASARFLTGRSIGGTARNWMIFRYTC